jgi:hypothetical protein
MTFKQSLRTNQNLSEPLHTQKTRAVASLKILDKGQHSIAVHGSPADVLFSFPTFLK